jgi:hypothetical protein
VKAAGIAIKHEVPVLQAVLQTTVEGDFADRLYKARMRVQARLAAPRTIDATPSDTATNYSAPMARPGLNRRF